MNLIIPMAGMGSRLRPHTLTTPKPLLLIAGKTIVQRIVEELAASSSEPIAHIGFVIGPNFGDAVENALKEVAERLGAQGHIYYQHEPLGTAHAVLCAKPLLKGNVIIAFADTLFKAHIKLDTRQDAIIWVHEVEDPSRYGVVRLNKNNLITEFHEKPSSFISRMAIIGIYFFKDGDVLHNELQYLIDNNILDKGEYQLTSALTNLHQKGAQFGVAPVNEWLDCGHKDAVLYANQRVLELLNEAGNDELISSNAYFENTTVIDPCYVADKVPIKNSVIGPYVSIEQNTTITNSIISNAMIQNNTNINYQILHQTMIGNHVLLNGKSNILSLGDYNTINE